MRKFLCAAALLCAPALSDAQTIIGTTPAPVVEVMPRGGILQSFVAEGTELSRISFWFYGGTAANERSIDYFVYFNLYSGVGRGGFMISPIFLSHLNQGRLDVVFDTPLSVMLGAAYSFEVYLNNCDAIYEGGCGSRGMPITGVVSDPRVEVTTTDSYAGGTYLVPFNDFAPTPGRDIRFEAEFTSVPEPSTVVLLGAGMLMIGVGAGRRHRRANT